AIARATHAEGCIARRDASGRAVVPLRGLPLHRADQPIIDDYGLDLESVERRDLQAVQPRVGPAGDRAAARKVRDLNARFVGHQANIEWLRSGSGAFGHAHPLDPDAPPPLLHDVVVRHIDAWPVAFRPWLGDAQKYENAALSTFENSTKRHSVSRTVQPLTHCLYQAYLSAQLQLRPRDPLVEDLDAR